jgi:Icc-related predicted phosphoesterase
VLGNHDHHSGQQAVVSRQLEDGGVVVLESTSCILDVAGTTVAIIGSKGFGGGFVGASLAPFGEEEMKAFARTSIDMAAAFERLLSEAEADLRIGLLHYAPIRETLLGEPPEIFPFLGSYLFAEAVDRAGADLVVHGHAHRGTEWGQTPGGVPVRNVAKAVLRQAYRVYTLEPGDVSARQRAAAMGPDVAR